MAQFTYVGIAVALLARGIGLPLPEDLPLLVAGALCATGTCEPARMLPMVFGLVLISDSVSYGLGRRFGHHLPRVPLLGRMLTEERMTRVEDVYHTHGKKTLFVSRFLPALRTPFFFVAGTVRIPYWKFLLVDTAAALISVPLLVGLGWTFAQQLPKVIDYLQTAKSVFWGILLILVAVAALWELHRLHRRRND